MPDASSGTPFCVSFHLLPLNLLEFFLGVLECQGPAAVVCWRVCVWLPARLCKWEFISMHVHASACMTQSPMLSTMQPTMKHLKQLSILPCSLLQSQSGLKSSTITSVSPVLFIQISGAFEVRILGMMHLG